MPSREAGATGNNRYIPKDSVEQLVQNWNQVRPEFDFTPLAVILRMERLHDQVFRQLELVFEEHGLTAPGFAVLVTLVRLDDADGISQRRLMKELGLTSGTVSVRIDRLQEMGLVDRQGNEMDRRNTRITLTPEGRALIERIIPLHLRNERRLLAALSDTEQKLLAALLAKLLVEFEGSQPSDDLPPELGLTVAPAHITIAMRTAVGLPSEPGLLVRRVDEGAPASDAGLLPGDVIVGAGRRTTRSATDLYAALADATRGGRLELRVLRGSTLEQVVVRLALGTRVSAQTSGRSANYEHLM